jgi:nucleoporin POM34
LGKTGTDDLSRLETIFSTAVTSTILATSFWILWIFRTGFILQASQALSPLLNRDDLSDIPLTPSQRQLLGLPPTPTPPAEADICTPPRYIRSASSSSRAATQGSSSFKRSVSGGAQVPGSAGSSIGSGASPLMRQAFQKGSGKRWSLGTSGMDESIFGNGGAALPPTPTPSAGSGQRAVSVGLNSKWLYKRQFGGSPSGGYEKYM